MSIERGIFLESPAEGPWTRLRVAMPPVNVFGVQDLELFSQRVREARDRTVLLVSGLPKAFSAGVDIADHAPEPGAIDRMLAAMRTLLEALVETPAITVAAVSGACLGGGAEIAAACDLVFVAEDARIGFPEIRLGCFPPGGVALLPGRIGTARASEWILTGRTFSGREAAQAGFATRSLAADQVDGHAERAARDLACLGRSALGGARDLLRQDRREALAHALPRAEDAYRRLAGSEDLARAVEQFLKKN
jgi:cyclohexa-1,5-dienecarbonyl-CoA hydratase